MAGLPEVGGVTKPPGTIAPGGRCVMARRTRPAVASVAGAAGLLAAGPAGTTRPARPTGRSGWPSHAHAEIGIRVPTVAGEATDVRLVLTGAVREHARQQGVV